MDFSNLVEKEQLLYYQGFYYFEKGSPLIMYENCNQFMIYVRREIKLLENNKVGDGEFDIMFRKSPDLEPRINALREQWENIVLYFKQKRAEKQLQQLEKDFE
jgi:hypothetical protein